MIRSSFLMLLLSMLLSQQALASECVVLLHGLARTADSMKTLEAALNKQHYQVVNVDYPSRKYTVKELAKIAVEEGVEGCKQHEAEKINFVTHSLGGILVRSYHAETSIENINRVVMLGPPNQGSEVVDKLKDMPGFELINGPAGLELGTDTLDIPQSLGAVDFELGIIAGTKSINLFLSTLLPNKDDGKVSVDATKVEGMADFIALPTSHPFIMKNETVIKQTLYFLENGKFNKDE